MGIQGKPAKWIKAFLTGRTQEVVLNGMFSDKKPVVSGVRRGTVLGPLLFLIYINNMPPYVRSKIRLFADDAYLYRIIDSPNDVETLQDDLNQLQSWEKHWDMEFHPGKCKSLTITNKTKPLRSTYSIHNEQLENVTNAKYLGVTINKNLKWNTHIDSICKKAEQKQRFLQRNMRKCSRNMRIKAYQTYIQPIVNYASPVWNPVGSKLLIDKVENIQRKGARFVNNDWSWQSSPTQMLKNLDWLSLSHQRSICSLVTIHDIRSGVMEMGDGYGPTLARNGSQFVPIHGRILAYQNSFVPNVVRLWNELPKDIRTMNDRNSFKNSVEKFYRKP